MTQSLLVASLPALRHMALIISTAQWRWPQPPRPTANVEWTGPLSAYLAMIMAQLIATEVPAQAVATLARGKTVHLVWRSSRPHSGAALTTGLTTRLLTMGCKTFHSQLAKMTPSMSLMPLFASWSHAMVIPSWPRYVVLSSR